MPVLEYTDFSSGIVTAINEILRPKNSAKNLLNVDVWTESGAVKLLKSLTLKTTFPTGEVYDHHIIFPVYGVGEYALIMMQSGKLYAYDGSSFSFVSTFTSGARIVYAGGSAYVFYRHMTAPTKTNTERKIVEWDYSSSSWVVYDAMVKDNLSIASTTLITNGITNANKTYNLLVSSSTIDGGMSYGIENSNTLTNGQDYVVLLNKTADFEKAHVFLSFKSAPSDPTPEQKYLFTMDKTSGLVPFCSGEFRKTAANTIEILAEDSSGVRYDTALTWILGQYTSGAKNYIKPGSKVFINGKESTISSITRDLPPPEEVYTIVLNDNIVPDFSMNASDSSGFLVVWIEVFWDTDFPVPIQKRTEDLLESYVSDIRDPYKLTSGTGNYMAFAGGRLFTVNPYFPNVQSSEDEDTKGAIAWSEPNGFGEQAFSFIPLSNIIVPNQISGEVTGMESLGDSAIVFFKNAIVRLIYDTIVKVLQSEAIGMWREFNYFTSESGIFVFTGRKLYMIRLNNSTYETGFVDFVDLSANINDKFIEQPSNYDVRMFYDRNEQLLFVSDKLNNFSFICSLKSGKPVFVEYQPGITLYGGFNINGDTFFIMKDADYEIHKYSYDVSGNPVYSSSQIEITSNKVHLPEGRYYVRDVEIIYQNNGSGLTFTLYCDDSSVLTKTLPAHTTESKEEFKVSVSNKVRCKNIYWKLSGTPSSDFKLLGVFITYDVYSPETRGY